MQSLPSTFQNQRDSKRPRIPTDEEIFFQEDFPQNIKQSRKHFIKTEGDSSINKTTGTEHSIYFGPFLQHILVITGVCT
jgi:hypothetical protein